MNARRLPSARVTAIALVVGLVVAGCSGSTSLPDQVVGAAPSTTTTIPTSFPTCSPSEGALDATRSYEPESALPAPGAMPAGSTMAEIAARGRLVVGVSADTLLFGARNPETGAIEGFDVDVLREVALAIFGPGGDERIEYRVINYAQRLPSLEAGEVDLVAHTMTINCNRWKRIAFSSTYFNAGQKVLVKKGSGFTSIDDLAAAAARVCAPEGSTNIEEVRNNLRYAGVVVIGVADITDCLVGMQQGTADAATGDDTVLAGFAAQDPTTAVVGEQFTEEPYGLGAAADRVDLVQFVNSVLEEMRTDGRWEEIYRRWLIDTGALQGDVPPPPAAIYGREVPT